MIDARELRIGNWVLNGIGDPIRIDYFEYLREGYDCKFGQVDESEISVDFLTEYTRNASPIPLTEEILLKCGAAADVKSLAIIFSRFKLTWRKDYNYWYVLDKHTLTYLTKVEFVHEWQNFVKAMDGQELEIKL